MSLLVLIHSGRALARAVAGELPARELAALHAHLRGCVACRDRYDELARTADALDGGAQAAARERAALMDALDGAAARPAAAPRPRATRAAWAGAALVLAPLAVVLVWRARPAAPPDAREDVSARGADEPAAPFELVLHASRAAGDGTRAPVRLLGELPASGEVRVSRADFVQLSLRGSRAPTYVRVVTVDAAGAARDELPGAERGGLLAPAGAGLVQLGSSVALARDRKTGTVRVLGLASPRPIGDAQVRAALAGTALDPAVAVVAGLLIVEP